MIGINTMIFSPTGGSVGIGFAVPIDTARRVVPELIQFGQVRRGWIDLVPVQLFPALVRAAARLALGHIDDPDLDARWQHRVTTPAAPLFPRIRRTAPGRRCRDCRWLRQCVVCPAAGPDPERAPDAHCLYQRLLARPLDLGYPYGCQPQTLSAGTVP